MTRALTSVLAGFEKVFDDQTNEASIPELDVEGTLPDWLSGTLVRN